MMGRLAQKLSHLLSSYFIKNDPKARAFDSFYSELSKSRLFHEISKELQGHPHPCYNLCDEESYRFLRRWLAELNERYKDYKETPTFLEWGCGHAPLLGLGSFRENQYTGIDFSKAALDFSQEKFPKQNFILHHQNFGLPFSKKFKQGVAIDSLYGDKKINSSTKESLKGTFQKTLQFIENELVIYQNIYGPVTSDIRTLIPQFSGWDVHIENKTLDFHSLVASWQQALQRPEVIEDQKKYPLLWGTISKEMDQHQKSLRKKDKDDESTLYRLLIRYKRII